MLLFQWLKLGICVELLGLSLYMGSTRYTWVYENPRSFSVSPCLISNATLSCPVTQIDSVSLRERGQYDLGVTSFLLVLSGIPVTYHLLRPNDLTLALSRSVSLSLVGALIPAMPVFTTFVASSPSEDAWQFLSPFAPLPACTSILETPCAASAKVEWPWKPKQELVEAEIRIHQHMALMSWIYIGMSGLLVLISVVGRLLARG